MFSRVFALSNVLKLAQRQQPASLSGFRTLFSRSMLGIDSFEERRKQMIDQTLDTAERFRTKMIDFADPNTPSLVFTEDLKLMCYILNNDKDDLELFERMIKKFHNQNKELRFGTFAFGPVVMRLFASFNLPRVALKLFNDPETDGFFDQVTSFVVLADLLFQNEMYEEVIQVFEKVQEKQIQSMRYPKNLMTLVFAAMYKLNTPESYQKCINLLKELQEVGHLPVRRALCFAATLALKQNQPHVALELLSRMNRQSYITVRNLKAQALAELGRPDDALPILRSFLEMDRPNRDANMEGSFLREVVERVEEAVTKLDSKEVSLEFNRIKQILEEQGGIIEKDIDSFLLQEISLPASYPTSEKQYFEASYNTRNTQFRPRGPPGQKRNQFYQRPGLRDLA